jgi:hypothetical protein
MDRGPKLSVQDIELAKLDLEQRKQKLLEEKFEENKRQGRRFKFDNPLIIAIAGAFIAGVLNIVLGSMNDAHAQRDAKFKSDADRSLASMKAESDRILEAVKTGGDPEQAEKNLDFLIGTGLISDQDLKKSIRNYLIAHPAGTPVLGTASETVGKFESDDKIIRRTTRAQAARMGKDFIPVAKAILAENRVHSPTQYRAVLGVVEALAQMSPEIRCPAFKKDSALEADVAKHGGISEPSLNVAAKKALSCGASQ